MITRNADPWKEYPQPKPLGYIYGIPSLNGELLRYRGQMAVMQLPDGREIDVHLQHFVKAQSMKP